MPTSTGGPGTHVHRGTSGPRPEKRPKFDARSGSSWSSSIAGLMLIQPFLVSRSRSMRASTVERLSRAKSICSGGDATGVLEIDCRVVVLGPDLLDVLDPRTVVGVGVALADGVLEVPRLALVGPVVGLEAVGLSPVGDGGFVVAGAVEVLTELEVGGGPRLSVVARVGTGDDLVR